MSYYDKKASYAGIIRIRFNRSESFLHSLSACRGKLPLCKYEIIWISLPFQYNIIFLYCKR